MSLDLKDVEKWGRDPASLDFPSSSSSPPRYSDDPTTTTSDGRHSGWHGIVDGFRRDPNAKAMPRNAIGHKFNIEDAASATANTPLARNLKSRHLQMIAIGGSIGTGLFVGSGTALANGGPASVVICFCLIGVMLYCTVQALGEMTVLFPVAGSFAAYATRFLDPAWGFAMGWNYAFQWLVSLPIEVVAASFTISYWDHGRINSDAWVIIFLALIISINFFGVKGYGEAEYVFSTIKAIAVIGFIVMGIVLCAGSGPEVGYQAGHTWVDPGAFNHGFKGVCSVFATAAFAFSGTELVGLAAAETANPRKALPQAVKQVFWRITLFYVVSLTLVGLLVRFDNPNLIQTRVKSTANVAASPFVIAISQAGINVLPSVFNAVILIAVLSVGNSAVFGSSRTLAALAEQRQAPGFLAYIDRRGRPLVSIIIASAIGFLAFFAGSNRRQAAFNWMIALSGLSSIFTWGSICLAHIRFRRAWKLAGRSLDELGYRSQSGVVGSWIGFVFNVLVLIAVFWTGLSPVGKDHMSDADRVQSWFGVYLALPVVLFFYVPYKIWFKTRVVRTRDIDLTTGVRELEIREFVAEERMERLKWGRAKKVYKFFC